MWKLCAAAGFVVAVLGTLSLLAQTPEKRADRGKLPDGARLRLGMGGVQVADAVSAGAVSGDGKLLAVGDADGGVAVLELQSGKRLCDLKADTQGPLSPGLLAFSADNRRLVFGNLRGLFVADLPAGSNLRPLSTPDDGGSVRIHGLSLSADGQTVAAAIGFSAEKKQRVLVWDLKADKTLGPIEVAQNNAISTALSPDGKTLATWGKHYARMIGEDQQAGQVLQSWDVASGKERRRFTMDRANANVTNAVFAPDGKTLAVASGLSTFHLFDVESARELRRFSGRRGLTTLLDFSPDGKTLAAGNFEGLVQAWHVDSGHRLDLAAAPKSRLLGFGFPAAGHVLALGLQGRNLVWWDAVTGRSGADAQVGHSAPVLALAFTPDGKTLYTASNDAKLFAWDVATGAVVRRAVLADAEALRILGAGTRINTLTLSPNAKYAATSNITTANNVCLWRLSDMQPLCDFETERTLNFYGVGFTPDGAKLLATATSKSINVWETATGQELAKLSNEIPVRPVAGNPPRLTVSPDGAMIAVAVPVNDDMGQPGTKLLLLDATTGKEVQHFDGSAGFLSAAAFSPDSRLLAVPSVGRSVALVRTATGKEWRRLGAPDAFDQITALAIAPDGRTLALAASPPQQPGMAGTGDVSPTIEVWELASGKLRARFRGHFAAVNALAFSPDGTTLASGGADTAVILWDVSGRPTPAELAGKQPDLAAAWAALAKEDAGAAYAGMKRLVGAPADAVSLLKTKLQPARASAVDDKAIGKHIAELDSETFASRTQAFRALERLGPAAEKAIRTARKTPNISLEMRRRLDDLIDKIDRSSHTPEELQAIRGIEVLERIASPDARAVLAGLAKGSEQSRLTAEAREAVGRLK
jgi:WD40 repeat protein